MLVVVPTKVVFSKVLGMGSGENSGRRHAVVTWAYGESCYLLSRLRVLDEALLVEYCEGNLACAD